LDLHEYWKQRGKTFDEELENQSFYGKSIMRNQEKHVIKILRKNRWKKILEVGCGSGRLTKKIAELPEIEKFVAMDMSPDLIESAKKNTRGQIIEFQCIDLQNYNSKEKFDLVFSCEVMMHIPHQEIKNIISNIVSLSKQKVILVEFFDPEKIGSSLGGYCFVHDYKKIFENVGVKRVRIHMINFPISIKLVNSYAKLRGRKELSKQAIIEVDV